MIFAKVDVELLTHPRVLRIPRALRGECVGVWLMALLYSRRHELDGFCPLDAIDQVARAKVLTELVTVGLITREIQDGIHGVRILRYADRNETKAEIDARRESDRKRKSGPSLVHSDSNRKTVRPRSGTPPDSERNPPGFQSQGIPDSGSDSGSVSSLDLRPPRINPAAQSFQDNTRDPGSGVVRAADGLRPVEKPRKDHDSVAKAIEETKRLERAMAGKS